jgi:hypothetical protein
MHYHSLGQQELTAISVLANKDPELLAALRSSKPTAPSIAN